MPTRSATKQTEVPALDWRKDPGFIESVVQTSDALIVVLNGKGRIVFLNRACERATGYELDRVVGRLIWGLLIAPEERTQVRRLFDRVLVGDYPCRYENDWITSDSKRIRVSWSNTALTDDAGRVTFVVATGTEVTEQRRTEEALRRATERAEALFETAPQAIVTVTADGLVASANGSAARIFGYEQDALVGKPVEELMPLRFREAHLGLRENFLASSRERPLTHGLQFEAQRQDGSVFPVEVGLSQVAIAGERLAVAFISDISARVAAEAEAEAAGRRVQDLAQKLLTVQEEERRRIAQDLHDDFTHRLALNGIELGFLHREIDDEHADWRARIKSLQDETLSLTDEARRLSHELHPAALEHCGIVTALETQCQEFSKTSGVEVDLIAREVDDSLPREISTTLYRITQEAVRNALKHAHARHIRIFLSSDADELHLTIADDGRGFDLEQVRAQGTSVGLTSIEERSRQIGGDFRVRSVPGEGARVEISVPLPHSG